MIFFRLKSKKMKAILITLILPFYVFSQESNLGNWLIYVGNKSLNNGFNIHNEVQYRNHNTIGDLEQLLIRTGLGYNLTEDKHNLLLGYGYILSKNYINETDDKVSVEEHRIFQQFTTIQSIGKIGLSHRYRLEERFIESDFKMRFRYFLGLKIPLQNKENEINSFYLSAYNEIFLNNNPSVFDRNRVYGGLGYQLSKVLKFELGYMNQIFENSSRDQINIIAFVNF